MPRSKHRVRRPAPPSDPAVTVTDPSIAVVSRSFERVWPREQQRVRLALRRFLPVDNPVGTILDPPSATDYLHRINSLLESEARTLAQIYSPACWLWYFRRLSREYFASRLSTTAPADHLLAEALTGLSCKLEDIQRYTANGAVVYPMDDVALRPVARMASLAVVMSQCHAWIRRAGKGASFTVHADRLPEPVPNAELEASIELYDQRVANDPDGGWLQGLRSPDHDISPAGLLMTVAYLPGAWPTIPSWLGKLTDGVQAQVKGQFAVCPSSLEDLRRALEQVADDTRRWWPESLPSLVLLLQAMMYVLVLDSPTMGVGLPKVGYVTVPRAALMRTLDWTVQQSSAELKRLFRAGVPSTAEEVMRHLHEISPVCWPFQPGPVLRFAGDQVVVDVHAATQRLVHMVTMPRDFGGKVINVISEQFEIFVQNALNQSPWRPDRDLEELRGRDLKLRSKAVTDVDAIANRDGTLFLVSCKNIPRTETYTAGEYRVVRNVEQYLDDAVSRWDDVIATLRRDPVGDNYDFSAFEEICGVVVTPHVMYSRSTETTTVVKRELRKASSLGELLRFTESLPRIES